MADFILLPLQRIKLNIHLIFGIDNMKKIVVMGMPYVRHWRSLLVNQVKVLTRKRMKKLNNRNWLKLQLLQKLQ